MADASEIPYLVPEFVADLPNKILNTSSGSLWMALGGWRFAFVDPVTGDLDEVAFHDVVIEDEISFVDVLPDRQHILIKQGDSIGLWHATEGQVAFAPVHPRPQSPFAMDAGRPEWDGHMLTEGGMHLWYFGYDADASPTLTLFDARTLELLDTHTPRSSVGYPRPEAPERLSRWGDFGASTFAQAGAREPVGMFANYGDSFGHFSAVTADDGRIVACGTLEVELAVQDSSDQSVWYMEWAREGAELVVCDDVGLLSLVDVASAERTARSVDSLGAFERDYRLHLPSFEGSCRSYAYDHVDMTADATHVFMRHEVSDAAELEGDMPRCIWTVVDKKTLETVALMAPERIAGVRDLDILDGGVVFATKHDESKALYRLPELPGEQAAS